MLLVKPNDHIAKMNVVENGSGEHREARITIWLTVTPMRNGAAETWDSGNNASFSLDSAEHTLSFMTNILRTGGSTRVATTILPQLSFPQLLVWPVVVYTCIAQLTRPAPEILAAI